MASVPSNGGRGGTVNGRVNRDGLLVQADPILLRLQEEAGSKLGALIALPQIAAVVRSAMRLGVPLSRSVIAASATEDFDLWVRAEPNADGASLTIDGWKARPPAPPRLTLVGSQPASAEGDAARQRIGQRVADGAAKGVLQRAVRRVAAHHDVGEVDRLAAIAGRRWNWRGDQHGLAGRAYALRKRQSAHHRQAQVIARPQQR